MTHAPARHHTRRTRLAAGAAALLAGLAWGLPAGSAEAAGSTACEGGGFRVLGAPADATTQVASPGAVFRVQGTHVQFDVVAATFEVKDYAFLPTGNKLDMTGGNQLDVWASKEPQHGGRLTSPVTVSLNGDSLSLQRTGTLANGVALDMKVQAKDCAAGGIFQMEVGRADGAKTRFVHRLAGSDGTAPFYYDNAEFAERIGQYVTADADGNTVSCTPDPADPYCVKVSQRTNIGSDLAEDFVARDSPQGGTGDNRTEPVNHPECRLGTTTLQRCGGVSVWDVASGGRMGFVTGEDAVEVANPPTTCTQDCQAQNQVRGRLAVLGFPWPVPAADRSSRRLCSPSAACPDHL